MVFSFVPRLILFQAPIFIWVILGILLLAVILGLILGEKMSEGRQLREKEESWLPPGMIPQTGKAPVRGADFLLLHGIDEDTQLALNNAGIRTFEELAETSVHDLGSILFPHPIETVVLSTWADQAEMAAGGRWAELQAWQAQMREKAGQG